MRAFISLSRMLTSLSALVVVVLGPASCSLIIDSDIAAAGLGAACASDADCQGSTCNRGICVSKCEQDTDCPAPTQCFAGLCQQPLKVRGVWVGIVSSGEGWTLTHHEGMDAAKQSLPYVDFRAGEALFGDSVLASIDDFAKEGAQVVVANSFDHRFQIEEAAAKYPHITFLICSGKAKPPNTGSYFAHMEQAWFVAGQLAAKKTKSRHLGFIGTYVTPEVVRHLNAFALGARNGADNKDVIVEVRWTGFWYDPGYVHPAFEYTPLHMGSRAEKQKLTAEEYVTAKLIDSGADVIAHQVDNQSVSRYVAKHTKDGTVVDAEGNAKDVWTIANDNRYGWRGPDAVPLTNAIGSVYWNWGPMYEQLLDQIHRKQWASSDVMERLSDENSVVGFQLSTGEQDITAEMVRTLIVEAENEGPDRVFRGPWKSTGQRESGDMGEGETIKPEEYSSMCWFVEGVVERANPNDPTSPLIAAKVPDDTHKATLGDKAEPPVGKVRKPTSAPEVALEAFSWSCTTNR